jgi:hypothetical protein
MWTVPRDVVNMSPSGITIVTAKSSSGRCQRERAVNLMA